MAKSKRDVDRNKVVTRVRNYLALSAAKRKKAEASASWPYDGNLRIKAKAARVHTAADGSLQYRIGPGETYIPIKVDKLKRVYLKG